MRIIYYRVYYHLLDRDRRNKAGKDFLESIGYLMLITVAILTGAAFYAIVPVLLIETAIKAGTNMFLICLSIAVCGLWTLCWIAGIQKLIK